MRRTVLTIFAAMGAFCLPATASAEEVTVRVGYQDLDLRNPADVKVLEKRVKKALRTACKPAPALASFSMEMVCFRDAAKRATREIERHRVRYAARDLRPAG